jgi:nucleoside-diphosphate-sugar epimerase
MPAPSSEAALNELLSRPTDALVATLRQHPGDILVLGAGGKMGPSLARMARRALDAAASPARVIAVARFGDPVVRAGLEAAGVDTIRADLADPTQVAALPDAPNLIFMAGQKFGTTGSPATTWGLNVVVPVRVADRYPAARIVVFSTGNVYPLVPVSSGGARETDPVGPVGEYAMSCLGRERVFQHAAESQGPKVLLFRLNYAIDLRYGVLVDTALKVRSGQPIDLRMGHANVIWQGDANDRALRSLAHTASPATVLNVTGPETVSVRALAREFGRRFKREPVFTASEAPDALLSNASRATELFGPPTVSLDTMIDWTADWLLRGGGLLGKPTHFEEREGRF